MPALRAYVLAGIGAGRHPVGKRAQRLHVDIHVHQLPLNGLALRQRLAEGDALFRPLDRHVQGPLHLAQRVRTAQQPVVDGEPALAQPESVAYLAEHVGLRNTAVLEVHDVLRRVRTEPGLDSGLLDMHAGIVPLDQEHRDSATLPLLGVGHRLHHDHVGFRSAGYPHLGAVEHPVLAVLHGPGLHHAARVGARVGLRLGEAGGHFSFDDGL